MGDEELNFTEEEARCWANDPKNQPFDDRRMMGILILCVLLLVALIAFAIANGSGAAKSDGGVAHGERAQAGTTSMQ
jgi:hypothetical protein